MKQLGFDKPCLAKYITSDLVVKGCYKDSHILHALFEENEICEAHILVPTFSQAFRWFREKYDLFISIFHYENGYAINDLRRFDTHEEAEVACLTSLIELAEARI